MADMPGKGGCRGGFNDDNYTAGAERCPAPGRVFSIGAHDCDRRLQSLAGAAGGALHPSVHRHGLRLHRVLAAAVARDRADRAEGLPGHVADAGTVHHHLRLEGRQHGLDVYAVLRRARRLRRDLGRLAGAGRSAQGRFRRGAVLVRRSLCSARSVFTSSALDHVARRRRDRRRRSRPRLHLAGVDADQMVPRPSRHGDRHGHHGLRRRRHDRRAAGEHPDQLLQDPDLGRRLGNLRRHGRDLLRVHDDRRVRLSRAAGRLAARRLDAADARAMR